MFGGDCTADADEDGICDDEDTCIGELNACGVCNGDNCLALAALTALRATTSPMRPSATIHA